MKKIFLISSLIFPLLFSNGNAQESQNSQNNNGNIILNIPNNKYEKLKSQLAYCGTESNSELRLSCYESYISEAGIKIYHINDNDTLWVKKNDGVHKDWIATLKSGNIGRNGQKTALVLRCHAGEMSVYFKYGSPVGNRDIRIDLGLSLDSMGSYNFSPSQSEDALGIWTNNNAALIGKFIAQNPTNLFVKTNFTDGVQVDSFRINGSDTALTDVRRACNW